MRTIKEILASGGQIDNTIIALKNGMLVEGFLVHERVDKVNDTEGYNIYDIRMSFPIVNVEGKDYEIELYYGTLEPDVFVNWADSIATRQTIDFSETKCLDIDNDDVIKREIECIKRGESDDD